jgi:putative component of membrane protein insertase Oxa1/YidC/SpoIIIJ protein YidD
MLLLGWLRTATRALNRGLACLGYFSVLFYRLVISPRKGFKCAHGALTSEPSCSAVALEAFRTETFTAAVQIIHKQLTRCRRTFTDYKKSMRSHAAFNKTTVTLVGIGALSCCGGEGGGGSKRGGGGEVPGDGPERQHFPGRGDDPQPPAWKK